ncbi:uncharacterized protein C8Q71DRAFT_348888 [Rhodofomes roseus]|uniref:Uncharacterized protein n=1 Tax=Rhodofomes roseus TaxID=34475 RepID=A0ABQ8KU39_9APHY|nr:uncharacterized protein C8Q71DRAFT_348888 [Rhodofomes roseus]KAH9841797.1 hypothetical protein C8Q71DRAFT_348888 [Rhodofomes roseus]
MWENNRRCSRLKARVGGELVGLYVLEDAPGDPGEGCVTVMSSPPCGVASTVVLAYLPDKGIRSPREPVFDATTASLSGKCNLCNPSATSALTANRMDFLTKAVPTRTVTMVHTSTASPNPADSTSPPIVELLRFASSLLSVLAALTRRSFSYVVSKPLWTTLAIAYRPLSYLLAPLFVFVNVLLNAFILTPYAVVRAIAVDVYPIYVFVGASLLCAACVGLGARLWVQAIRSTIYGPRPTSHEAYPPAKPRKRVSIKEEER